MHTVLSTDRERTVSSQIQLKEFKLVVKRLLLPIVQDQLRIIPLPILSDVKYYDNVCADAIATSHHHHHR